MDNILTAVLNVLGVFVLIAVGAFLIVFLSDLLISIIDRKNGIFFKRKEGKEATKLIEKSLQQEDLLTNDEDLKLEFEKKPEQKSGVDMIAAQKEQEMLASKLSAKPEESKVVSLDEERLNNLEKTAKVTPEPLDLNFDEIEEKPDTKTESSEQEPETEDELEKMYMDLIGKINSEASAKSDEEDDDEDDEVDNEQSENKADEEDEEEDEDEDEEDVEEDEEVEVQTETHHEEDDEKVKELEQRLKELNSLLSIERENAMQAVKKNEELQQELSKKADLPLNCETMETLTSRLEVLQTRLVDAEKNLKANKKEFIPLQKIKKTLESDKTKLRRKEAIVAKQKVLLFGVNNYVADPEKQKKLENDLDVLDALRVSVRHCEEVMEQNEDRYPVLEKTHNILVATVQDIKSDIESVQARIKAAQGK